MVGPVVPSNAFPGDAASHLTCGQNPNSTGQATPLLGQPDCPQTSGSVTVTVELGPQTRRILAGVHADLRRLADHFDPQPPDVVGTPYLANRLGCTPTWIAQMVRTGDIPKGCIVPGSGKGRQWKFYRRRIEDWLASR